MHILLLCTYCMSQTKSVASKHNKERISIDFGKEKYEKNKKIQISSPNCNIYVNQVSGSLFVAFFGQKISFKSKNYHNDEQKVALELLSPKNITLRFNENTNLTIHNRFNSNKFLAADFTLILNKSCTITFLKCSYNEKQFKMNIIQDFPTSYYISSSFLPADLQIGQNSTTDIYFDTLNLKLKSIHTSSSFNLISSQKNSKIFIQELQSKYSEISINTNSEKIEFDKIDLNNTILNIPNSRISSTLCFIKNISQINCSNLYIYRTLLYPIENHIYFVAEDLSLEIIVVNNLDGVKKKNIIISKTPSAPRIVSDSIYSSNSNFVKRNYLYHPETQFYSLDLINKRKNVFNRLIVTESDITIDETYVTKLSDLKDFLRKSMDYSNFSFDIEIWDDYKTKTIKIANIAGYRKILNIRSKYFSKVRFYDEKQIHYINFDNVLVDDTYFVATTFALHNAVVSENCQITVLGSLKTTNSSLLTPNITYNSSELRFLNDIVVDEKTINDSLNSVQIKGDFGLIARKNVKINYDHLVNKIEYEGTNNTYIISDIQLNNPTSISTMRKLYLDFKYLPTNLTLSTPEYFIFDKTKISNETNLALEFPITIDSESKRDVVLNTLHLQSKSILDLTNNVKIFTNVLNVSTSKQPNKVTLNTKILSVLEDSFTTIDKVNGVEFIDIHYSVFKLGFIHINSLKSLKANNQTKSNIEDKNITLIYVENAKKAKCPGGLHVRFYNDDIEDQFFYDGDWDDFNIDFICFDSFEVNESCLSYEFLSHHWDFNGSTRTFDMSISKKNSQTCISLVHRDADSKDGSKNPGDKKIKIIIYSLIGVLIVIIIVIIAVAVICKKRNKKKYIIRFASDNASEALTESLLAME